MTHITLNAINEIRKFNNKAPIDHPNRMTASVHGKSYCTSICDGNKSIHIVTRGDVQMINENNLEKKVTCPHCVKFIQEAES